MVLEALARICSLLSGGKDSNYALYASLKEGHTVQCIVTVRPARQDSWMFHYPAVDLARLQVRAMGFEDRHYIVEVSGVKEREVEELASFLERLYAEIGFDVIVAGGIASEYQKRRLERIAQRIGVDVYAPQWGMEPGEYMRRLIEEGFEFIVTQITTYGLGPEFLGVKITREIVEEIIARARRHGFNPAFEGGEAETLVLYQPLYRDRRLCVAGKRLSRGEFEHILIIERAWLDSRDRSCLTVE